jgi:hypothetical protein
MLPYKGGNGGANGVAAGVGAGGLGDTTASSQNTASGGPGTVLIQLRGKL